MGNALYGSLIGHYCPLIGACSQHANCLDCFHAFKNAQLFVNLTKFIRMTICFLFTISTLKKHTHIWYWKKNIVLHVHCTVYKISEMLNPLVIEDDKEI